MDETSLIAAFQLADSFFPSGMVTFSHGLETFSSLCPPSGMAIDQLLRDYLTGKIAPCELVAYAHAYRAAEDGDLPRLQAIDQLLTASLLPQEVRQGSARSGRAFVTTLHPLMDVTLFKQFVQAIDTGQSDGNASVCLGLLCFLWNIPVRV